MTTKLFLPSTCTTKFLHSALSKNRIDRVHIMENKDQSQNSEFDEEFAISLDENYVEQGYLWMCGICENGPTFETIYDLFNHKKLREHLLQVNQRELSRGISDPDLNISLLSSNTHVQSDTDITSPGHLSSQKYTDKYSSAQCSKYVSPPSPASSDDIPLANLFSKLNSINVNKTKDSSTTVSECEENNLKLSGNNINNITNNNKNEQTDLKSVIDNTQNNLPSITITEPDNEIEATNLNQNRENSIFDDSKSLSNEKKDSNINKINLIKEEKKENVVKLKARHICKICNSEFPTRFSLSVHKKTHLFKDTGCYKCETCGKMCPKYDNFTRHLTIHFENREKSHQCTSCFASFYNLADLKRHLVLHLSVKPYTCEHCGEGFTRQDSLLIHSYKHTGVLCMKYACKDCDKVLNSQSALVMHVKTHSVKTVFCSEPGCKFSCYLQSQLRQHVRKHSGEKPFQCAKCGRCFARSNDMKNHVLNVHEGVRPFKCPACPKEFALVGNLRIHYTTHTNERPYLCAQCGKSFNHPSTLRKHSVTVHSPWRNQNKPTRLKKTDVSLSLKNFADLKKGKGR